MRILLIFLRYSSSFTAYPWLFSRGGRIEVDVIANANHSIHHSVWVKNRVPVHKNEVFWRKLRKHLDQVQYDDVLCVDEPARDALLAPGIVRHFPEIKSLNDRLLSEGVATNKSVFTDWCRGQGLGVPDSIQVGNPEEAYAAAEKIGLPCVFKGLANSGGRQMIIVRDEDDLAKACGSFKAKEKWLVQELIKGFVGTSVFVSRNGNVFGAYSYINQCATARGFGPAVVCKPHSYPSIEHAVKTIGSHFNGFTGFDWMLRTDGSLVLIDPHFGRMVPSGSVAHLAGIDLGAAYYQSLSGEALAPTVHSSSAVYFWIFPQCFQLLLEGGALQAVRQFSPFRREAAFFFCAPGEWRMACHQTWDYLLNWLRVRLGAVKQILKRLFRRK